MFFKNNGSILMISIVLKDRVKPYLWLKTFLAMVGDKVKAHSILIILCLIFFITSFGMNYSFGQEMGSKAGPYLGFIFGFILPLAFAASLVLVFFYLLLIKRPDSPAKALIAIYRPLLIDPQRYANAISIIGCLMLAFIAFADMKPLIPMLNPFSWDENFMRLDRLLHFGQDPWRLLDPILGHPVITQWINYVYNIWFVIMFSFWISAALSTKTHTEHASTKSWERQFLLSFLLVWIIGGIMFATIFSSMGPAFYDLVDPINNPFAPQITSLNAIHDTHLLWAVDSHAMLRDAYLNPAPGKLSGISAMPSIHNATSTIFMLAAYRIHRKFGHIMLAFLICILVGSVHLAWHYAVDAYAGIIIAIILWKFTAALLSWQDKILPPETAT